MEFLMNANELADDMENGAFNDANYNKKKAADFVRQQQAEIENLKNANRFIQNFAEEQHQRAVALEMRELTDAEIIEIWSGMETDTGEQNIIFARAILRKASE